MEIGLLIKQAKSSSSKKLSSASIMPEIAFLILVQVMSYACAQINILTAEYCSLVDGSLTSFGRSQFQIKRSAVSGCSLFYTVPQAPARIIPQLRP